MKFAIQPIKKEALLRFLRKTDLLCPLFLFLILLAFYAFYAAPLWLQYRYTTWDALRDIINARHLLEGGAFLADPVLDGYGSWYPPTHAAILAAAARLFHTDLIWTYALSAVGINWLSIAAFYVLAYKICNRNPLPAFLTTLSLAALPWVVTYVLLSPTVMAHATVAALILIAVYAYFAQSESRKNTALLAACVGAMGLFHPPTFLILFGALFLHWYMRVRFDSFRGSTLFQAGLFLIIALGISSPYWLSNLLTSVLNPEPIRYIAPALYHLEFVLPGKSVLRSLPILIPAAIGLWIVLRRRREPLFGFLMALAMISVLGQIPVYFLAILKKSNPDMYEVLADRIPILVPHEFQMYAQICAVLLMGLGLSAVFSSERIPWIRRWVGGTLILSLCASLIPSLIELPQHGKLFLWPYREQGEWNGVVRYICENTDVRDTICSPNDPVSFFVVGVQTGRKSLVSFASHLNTRCAVEPRRIARDRIFYEADREEILQIGKEYNIRYLLCSRKITSPERIARFREWFPALYDDEVVTLFILEPLPAQN